MGQEHPKTHRRARQHRQSQGLSRSDTPFLVGLGLWILLLLGFALNAYPLIPTLLGSALGGIFGGGLVSWYQNRTRRHGSSRHRSQRHGSRQHGSRQHGSRQHGSRQHGSQSALSAPLYRYKPGSQKQQEYYAIHYYEGGLKYRYPNGYPQSGSEHTPSSQSSPRGKRPPISIKDWLDRYGR
jgi:hypothetical protein